MNKIQNKVSQCTTENTTRKIYILKIFITHTRTRHHYTSKLHYY